MDILDYFRSTVIPPKEKKKPLKLVNIFSAVLAKWMRRSSEYLLSDK